MEGRAIMARKLEVHITNLGFFELALAAPSMKAALVRIRRTPLRHALLPWPCREVVFGTTFAHLKD
jgi:hypothetical protein